jgi:hypothetical protein
MGTSGLINFYNLLLQVYIFVKELVTEGNMETLADKLGSYGVSIPQYQRAMQQRNSHLLVSTA